MERRERRLLLYAAHSGLGNQLVQLGSALLLAKLLNRTLVLPPILEHGEVAGPGRHGSCSGSAAAHATLARRALQLYQRHATANMRQRFDDVFDLSSYAVAPFRPGLQWAFDFSAQASLCEHTPRSTEWLRRLAGRTDELLMVGSLHYGRNVLLHALAQTRLAPPWSPRAQHHFAIEQASALTGDNGPPFVPPWNRSRFPHAAFSGFGAFACMCAAPLARTLPRPVSALPHTYPHLPDLMPTLPTFSP